MTGAVAFSSQFVPIHSPLISSIVDFVCSSEKVVLSLSLCRCQSPQIGCVFVTVNSVNSVNILYFSRGPVDFL